MGQEDALRNHKGRGKAVSIAMLVGFLFHTESSFCGLNHKEEEKLGVRS